MRISDWSSDVCSSDLGNGHTVVEMDTPAGRPIAKWMPGWGEESKASIERVYADLVRRFGEERAFRIANRNRNLVLFPNLVINDHISLTIRSEERRVGKEFVSTCRFRLSPYH